MIVTYLRSSSYGSWDMCPQSYFLSYPLGIKQPSSKKMCLGSIVHKALELLAKKKLASQENQPKFFETEMGIEFDTVGLTVDESVEVAYKYYSEKESHLDWAKGDNKQCHNWTNDTLTMSNGIWNPLTRNIVEPEKYFDFTIDEPWAKYAYTLPDGSTLEGQLAMKGTTDLITRLDDDTLENIDWKTGRRIAWHNGEIKTYKKLMTDAQLRMYYYALATKLYPDVKHIIMSIVFIQDSKLDKVTRNRMSFSLPFDRDIDLLKTEEMIKQRFNEIKACNRPKLKKSWRCKSFCFFGKNNWQDTDTTICDHFEMETRKLGMTGVIKKYADIAAISSYGDGGGKSEKVKDD